MDDLALVGVHDDGDHLLLATPDGSRYRLRVDDALRAAVRSDRVRLSQLQLESEGRLRPREIQARIRAGETADEVATAANVSIAYVQRYEGPVLAEREYVAEQAQAVSVRRRGNADESLGALVAERLATREVEPGEFTWDAWRADDGSWTVALDFTAGTRTRQARWTYNPSIRHVIPQDDEARWLIDDEPEVTPEMPGAVQNGRRRLTTVREGRGGAEKNEQVFDVETAAASAASPSSVRVMAQDPPAVDLLETLRERRGRRSRPMTEEEELAGAPDPVREAIDTLLSRSEALGEPPSAHPARSRPHDARDGEILVLPDVDPELEAAALKPAPAAKNTTKDQPGPDDDGGGSGGGRTNSRSNRKQRRASVPSWDDIVFGQRRD